VRVITAPIPVAWWATASTSTVFLAGSIEMGAAEKWQDRVIEAVLDLPITILNPRRDDWDSSWVQSIDNPQFREQVEWELECLERANRVVFYLSPGTKSPITLLEIGAFTRHRGQRALVCCPEGFWRKGNIDIFCRRYDVPKVETLEDVVAWIRTSVVRVT